MLGRMWSNRNLYSQQNPIAILEDSLVVSYKAKNNLSIYFSNHSPSWAENMTVENPGHKYL